MRLERVSSGAVCLPYRPDIDGLRGIAVLAVLVFHAFPGKLPGGFVGVDIFFVISGFLISGTILKPLQNVSFSFADFYARRVLRIFPSLVLVLSVCLLLAWCLLLPDEFREFGRQLVGGATFISNIVLWRDAGYFDTAAQTKPLLHLWSLGIEEQFYIVWPAVLVLLWKRTSRVFPAICLLVLASFALNAAFVNAWPVGTFYLPGTRIWELLIGSALAYSGLNRDELLPATHRNLAAALGSFLLLLSVVFISENSFPGWWALLPTLGTALLMSAGSQAWINRRILANPRLVTVGVISYPLYLWHWPLLTYLRLIVKSDFQPSNLQLGLLKIGVMAVCGFLAWATWRYWELPLRRPGSISRTAKVQSLIAAMVVLTVCAAMPVAGVVTSRLATPSVMRIIQAEDDWVYLPNDNQFKSTFAENRIPSRSDRVTLFVGDSHINQYWPRAKAAIRTNPKRASAVFLTYPGCPPVPHLNREQPGYHCPEFYDYWTAQSAAAEVRNIVIGAYWEAYFITPTTKGATLVNNLGNRATPADIESAWNGLEATLGSLVRSGKRVELLSSSPASPTFDPRRALHRFRNLEFTLLQPLGRTEFDKLIEPVESRLFRIAARVGATVVRPADYFCSGDLCSSVDDLGAPIYMDADHLRSASVILKAAFIDQTLQP